MGAQLFPATWGAVGHNFRAHGVRPDRVAPVEGEVDEGLLKAGGGGGRAIRFKKIFSDFCPPGSQSSYFVFEKAWEKYQI